jgi:hypothetical protein
MTEAQILTPPAPLTLAQAIKEINNDTGTYPREAIDEILNHRTEAVPQLLRLLEEIIEDTNGYLLHTNSMVHLYAFELLSRFKATEAHSTIASILCLNGSIVKELFSDYIYTVLPETLVNTFPGNCEHLKRLVEIAFNGEPNYDVPFAAVDALFLAALSGKADRVEVLDYLAEVLRKIDQQKNHGSTALTEQIIETMVGLYPENHMDLIHQILSRKSDYARLKAELDQLLEDGLERTLDLSRSQLEQNSFPEDIHERLQLKVSEHDHCGCGHDHHHHHHHHHHGFASKAKPQKQALPRNQRLKNKKKVRANQRQARKKSRR